MEDKSRNSSVPLPGVSEAGTEMEDGQYLKNQKNQDFSRSESDCRSLPRGKQHESETGNSATPRKPRKEKPNL